MAKSYYEKLRDPRWQRKRLEIMERDKFACILCGTKDRTLNVDHAYYLSSTEPWDYPKDSLSTLCEKCHEETEAARRMLLGQLVGLSADAIRTIACVVQTLRLTPHHDRRGFSAILPLKVEPTREVV